MQSFQRRFWTHNPPQNWLPLISDWKITSKQPRINQHTKLKLKYLHAQWTEMAKMKPIFIKTSNQTNLNSSKRIFKHQWIILFLVDIFAFKLAPLFFLFICVCSIENSKKKLNKSSPETDSILYPYFYHRNILGDTFLCCDLCIFDTVFWICFWCDMM